MSYFGKFKGSYAGSWWGTLVAILTPSISGVCEIFSRLAFPARATDDIPSQTVNSVQIYRTEAVEFAPTMSISHLSLNPTNTTQIPRSESYTTAAASHLSDKTPQNESNALISTARNSNFVTDSSAEIL